MAQARRAALSAQGFGDPAPSGPVDMRHLRRLMRRVKALQLDSVNVLSRAHYLPAFSRLGPYDRDRLDSYAYRSGEAFEYWGHAASLMPAAHYPLFRFRMAGREPRPSVRSLSEEHPGYIESVLSEVKERGPLAVSDLEDPGSRTGPWWGYGRGKIALEWLFATGAIAVADRRNFTRYYDLPERVLAPRVLELPSVPRRQAYRRLLQEAAEAQGVATAADLADYHRLHIGLAREVIAELLADGRLGEVEVEGWEEVAYARPDISVPRQVRATALVSPFDSLVWARPRVERLFGLRYRIEIYVPKPKRQFGYYVLPLLHDERMVGRVDLKADRKRGALLVRGAYHEEGEDPGVVSEALTGQLRSMAQWLGLGAVEVEKRGNLAAFVCL